MKNSNINLYSTFFLLLLATVMQNSASADSAPLQGPEARYTQVLYYFLQDKSTGVHVKGDGSDWYTVHDAAGNTLLADARTGQAVFLPPGAYTLCLNNSRLLVMVTADQMRTVATGKIAVSGTGKDRYQVYDAAGKEIKISQRTNTEVELFPRAYTLYLHSAPLPVEVNGGERLQVDTGRVVVSGTGKDLYQVYDATGEKIRAWQPTNTEIELFPRVYALYLHGEPLTVSIAASELTTVNAGRLHVEGFGGDQYQVYDADGSNLRVDKQNNAEIELFAGDYQVRIDTGSPDTPRQRMTIRENQITRIP